MKIINFDRGEGKTHFLAQQSLLNDIPIVVMGTTEQKRLLEMYPSIQTPIPIYDILNNRMRGSRRMDKGIYIDELDIILESIMGCDIKLATTSKQVLNTTDLFIKGR